MAKDLTSFTLKIAVKADQQTIYNAWTQCCEIEKWFLQTCIFKDANGNSLSAAENLHAGCNYDWTWFLYDETEHGSIKEANGKDHFQFTFAGDCLVDIRLQQIGAYTQVALTQSNIPTDEASLFNIRIGCNQGWTFYLANLKSFYENGIDLRNKEAELKGLNN